MDDAGRLQAARKAADHIALIDQLAWKALLTESKSAGGFMAPANAVQPHRRPFQRAGAVSARLFGSTPPASVHVPLTCVLPQLPQAVEQAQQEITLRQPLHPKASTADRDFEIVFTLKAIIDACLLR